MSVKMSNNGLKLIHCNGFDIAASCEARFDGNESFGKQVYYPAMFLIYVDVGTLEVNHEGIIHKFKEHSVCLARKYTNAFFGKFFSKESGMSRSYTFVMPDAFLRQLITGYKFDKNLKPIGDRIVEIPATDQIKSIVQDVKYAVDNNEVLSTKAFESKVENTLKAIINANPKLAILFKEFSLAQRADLTLFMNTNYMLKVPLETMALMSGRSLSTFEREFKLIFNTTPHQWVLKKRLLLAYDLLISTERTVSDVYLEAGFEDLGHFSRAFKKEFGINPSEVKKQNKPDLSLT